MSFTELTLSEIEKFCEEHPDMTVTIADSEAAGNCTSGSQDFLATYFPGRDSATLKELRALAEGSNGLRMVIEYKIHQFQAETEERPEQAE